MTYPDTSWDIPKKNKKQIGYPGRTRNFRVIKTGGMSRDKSTCDFSLDIPRQVCFYWPIPAVHFSPLEKEQLVLFGFSQVHPSSLYPISHKISEGYPGIGHRLGYPRISFIKLGHVYNEMSQYNSIWGFNFEHNLRYPKITRDIMVYAVFRDARRDIPDPPPAQLA